MRKQENYLDYIPKRNSRYSYQLNEHVNVEIIVKNEGFWNRILQITLKKPRYSMIELEQMGSYVWQEMDGQKTVYELACMERERFGDRAEPAFERLSSYLKILRECGYICYVNKI